MLYLSNKRKEKKKKRNINNDLAILPSHDIRHLASHLYLVRKAILGKPTRRD